MSGKEIEALLALRAKGVGAVGRDRVAMLEAVAATGSITGAARALGLSYKAVWDGVNAINNLMPRPALLAQSGGRGGGGAALTEDGRRLILAFRRLEERLTRISAALLDDEADRHPDQLFWGIAMKTSARNAFRCQVVAVKRAAVNVEVLLKLSDDQRLSAIITNDSADDLAIATGVEVVALIKSSFVMLATGDQGMRLSASNRLAGAVVQRIDGGVNSEIVIDIGAGKTLTAVVTRESADRLGLATGVALCALFNPSQVILAVG